ncbi:MAG: DegT/DnrJ/EryC1/StrS family aminotransferase [Nitrososphaerales archaeon]
MPSTKSQTLDHIKHFEEAFAKFTGSKYSIAVSSGTSGLMTCMMALLKEPGQEVITTPLTFVATSNSALFAGGIPIFADVDSDTLCLDPSSVVKSLSDNTAAVIGVHLYGLPFEVGALKRQLGKRRVKIVEDAAQALGARLDGKQIGSIGDLAVFSFYGTKHISLGEGGMITTDDFELAEKCRMIISHGQLSKYNHTILGYNFRLPPGLAEAGLSALEAIKEDLATRRSVADVYRRELSEVKGLRFQRVRSGVYHSYYMFPIIVENASSRDLDDLASYMSAKFSSSVGRGYKILSYQQPLYRNIGELFWGAKLMRFPLYSRSKCANAESVVSKILELPTHPMTERKAIEISEALKQKLERIMK